MKKYIYLIATLFLLGGCTLSMEDWVLPEEERGQDEPYTVESDYGTITYQFADSVLYVTDKIQEQYIIRVEHDSILYFNGAIPDKFRPYVGMKMATGCSHLLPYGLNHRVLSVQDVGGILKVVATKVSTDEVYEHLSYCIDADLVAPDLGGMSEEELLDYGYEMRIDEETGDTIIHDWNEYDVDKGLRPAAAKRRSLKRVTRADDGLKEENSDEGAKDNLNGGTKTTTYVDVFVDTRDVGAIKEGTGLARDKMKGLMEDFVLKTEIAQADAASKMVDRSLYAGFGLKVVGYQKAHAEEDEDTNYELKYTDSWTEWTIKTEVGFEAKNNSHHGKDYASEAACGIPKKEFFDSMAEAIKNKAKPKDLINGKRSWDNAKIRIIITTTPIPIAFIASASFSPTVEISGNVSASLTYTSDKVRTGYENKNGKKQDIKDKVIEKGHWNSPQVIANGSVKIGAKFRAAAGLEFAGTLGVTCGANVEAYLELSGSMNISDAIKNGQDDSENVHVTDALSGRVRFYMDFYGDVTLHVAPLGISLWDKELARFLTTHIINFTTDISPEIDFTSCTTKFGKELGEEYAEYDNLGLVRGFYQIKTLDGINAFLSLNPMRYPGMRMYFGPVSDNNWIYMTPIDMDVDGDISVSQWKSAERKKAYFFEWIGVLSNYQKGEDPITEVNLVPTLYCYKSYFNPLYAGNVSFKEVIERGHIGEEILMKENRCRVEMGDPLITTVQAGQVSGGHLFNYTNEIEGYVNVTHGESGGQSINTENFRKYSFYTTLDVQNASRMPEWGVLVYIFGPDGKKKLMRRHQVPIDTRRSGKYTLIFNFATNWQLPAVSMAEEETLFFRVIPYWGMPNQSGVVEGKDANTLQKRPIKYEMDDITDEIMKKDGKAQWGTVMPNIDLNKQ